MGMEKIIKEIKTEIANQRAQERATLQEIAAMAGHEFAERAADALDPKKHLYSFEAYLALLDDLKMALREGVEKEKALECVQEGWRRWA